MAPAHFRWGKLELPLGWIPVFNFHDHGREYSGALTGEWKGADAKTLGIMAAGIVILMAAIVVVGTAGS